MIKLCTHSDLLAIPARSKSDPAAFVHLAHSYEPFNHPHFGKRYKCAGIATAKSVQVTAERSPDAIVMPGYMGDQVSPAQVAEHGEPIANFL